MRHLRLLIIALATICVLSLGAFALVSSPQFLVPLDDEIIIKGGSLEFDCGKNQGKDCLGDDSPGKVKAKHKHTNKHIKRIVVKDSNGGQLSNNNFDNDHQPSITITYK